MARSVIVAARRTAFGKFGGALRDVPATDLGAHAIRETLASIDYPPSDIDQIFFGMVVQAGAGQIPSRQAAMKAGVPKEVPSDTINKVCASSLRAVNLSDALIRAGDIQVAVAGGMENMSRAPFLLEKARFGYRMGDGRLVDSVVHDGLWCSFGDCHMGHYGSVVAAEFSCSREEQDAWAYRSQRRAADATERGLFKDEIAPLTLPAGDLFERDEAVRPDTTLEKLAALRPAFESDGTATAGNSPGLNDGASALLVMSEERARALGVKPLARILSSGQASDEPKYLATVPALAGKRALEKAGMTARDLDLLEINEAFASVTLISNRLLEVDPEKVNIHGGAIALGHPVGATGGRLLMTLIYNLRRRGGGVGLASLCSGGGQGEATIVEVDA